MKRAAFAPLFVALIALTTGGWFLQKGVSSQLSVYSQVRLFEEVVRKISDRFVDATAEGELYEMAIQGLLQELGDPHSALLDPREHADLQVQTRGEYGGLGIQIALRDGWITIIAPLPGTPAERVGLRAGDRIVEVDGESTRGWTEEQAVQALRGREGDPVDIMIGRAGSDEPIPFTVVRANIQVSPVPAAYMLGDGIGYVELTVFSETATEDVRSRLREMQAQGLRGLVLDMRGNPGGLLEQSFGLADLFLDSGETILETKGRQRVDNQRFTASSRDQFPDLPIVVLVSPHSASASEIVAGALQDHDRALVVGQTTFGKGSVQTLFPLRTGNYFLKLTTARWYTPSGRSIQGSYGVGEREPGTAGLVQRDTTERPTYRTSGGREVLGGGGIHPDLVVRDTLTTGEDAFIQAMNRFGAAFSDAVFAYSYGFVTLNPELRRDFRVTPEMLDGFYQELTDHDVEVERSTFDGASAWIARQLAFRITYTRWNQEAARQRWNQQDQSVRIAHDLLRRADSPESLFVLAAEMAPAADTLRVLETAGISGSRR